MKPRTRLTQEEAERLLEHFDMIPDEEERDLMEENDPELLQIIDKLQKIAEGE
jgi:hypothetical protein